MYQYEYESCFSCIAKQQVEKAVLGRVFPLTSTGVLILSQDCLTKKRLEAGHRLHPRGAGLRAPRHQARQHSLRPQGPHQVARLRIVQVRLFVVSKLAVRLPKVTRYPQVRKTAKYCIFFATSLIPNLASEVGS